MISSGGVSVGEPDYTKQILDEIGEIGFETAIKPGKPLPLVDYIMHGSAVCQVTQCQQL